MGMVDYEVEDLLPAVVKSLDGRWTPRLLCLLFPGVYRDLSSVASLDAEQHQFLSGRDELNIQGENTVFSPMVTPVPWR